MGLVEFETLWARLSSRLQTLLGPSANTNSHPIGRWLISGRLTYLSGERIAGCAEVARAQFVIEDLEQISGHDEDLFRHFKTVLRRDRSLSGYIGARQEIRLAASLISKQLVFQKSERPDFIVKSNGPLGLECTSAHLSAAENSIGVLLPKLRAAIATKSRFSYATPQVILVVDLTNVLFHEDLDPDGSWENAFMANLRDEIMASPFQSILCFQYGWARAGVLSGATITSHYARLDRQDISEDAESFLDAYFPNANGPRTSANVFSQV